MGQMVTGAISSGISGAIAGGITGGIGGIMNNRVSSNVVNSLEKRGVNVVGRYSWESISKSTNTQIWNKFKNEGIESAWKRFSNVSFKTFAKSLGAEIITNTDDLIAGATVDSVFKIIGLDEKIEDILFGSTTVVNAQCQTAK